MRPPSTGCSNPNALNNTVKGRTHTKPGTLLKHQVPIRTFSDWDNAQPGFFEMDLVGHDGGKTQGDYCFTLDLTDVATGWTELAAVPNKAQTWVFEALQALRQRLPFTVLGLDSDNERVHQSPSCRVLHRTRHHVHP